MVYLHMLISNFEVGGCKPTVHQLFAGLVGWDDYPQVRPRPTGEGLAAAVVRRLASYGDIVDVAFAQPSACDTTKLGLGL